MARLQLDRQLKLEPKRVLYAKEQIENLGYQVQVIGTSTIRFVHNGHIVTFYPYSGWATGKSITDGRGINNLLNQIK